MLKLIEYSGMQASYVALSYRWLPESAFKLTSANYATYLQEVPWVNLPAVFHNAVAVCDIIGVQYLWIDSLCILQDSAKDWEQESGRMQDVYRNADLVIAANLPTSASKENPFLGPRHEHLIEPVGFYNVPNKDEKVEIFLRPFLGHFRGITEDEPLAHRGWTYQEKLLARRCLTYTMREMQWLCTEKGMCECNEANNDAASDFRPETMLVGKTQVEIYDAWYHNVLYIYTRRALTYDTDRLPALAGAAKLFQEALGDEYLAGLWKGDLLRGLGWKAPPSVDLTSKRMDGKTPSWSWASVNHSVVFQRGDFCTPFTEVVDAKTRTSDSSPFGLVDGGYITLRGPLGEGWIEFPENGMLNGNSSVYIRATVGYPDYWSFYFYPDSQMVLQSRKDQLTGTEPANHLSVPEMITDESNSALQRHDGRKGKVWCLCLGIILESGRWVYMSALVLSRDEANTNQFRRLGTIQTMVVSKEDQPFASATMETVTIV